MKVYLLTTAGDGSDGDAWRVLGVYSSRGEAELAKVRFGYIEEPLGMGFAWSSEKTYHPYTGLEIEEWELDKDNG